MNATSEVVLKTTDLTKTYRKHCAVDHISLEVQRGEIYGLVGGQGAGKTTLIRLFLGLAKPTEGSFTLFGESSEEGKAKKRAKIGAMINGPAIYQNLTPMQNLKIHKKSIRAVDRDVAKEDLNELLELVGLDPEEKRKARELSGGAKQRLGIAISLLGNPELLLLDEPYQNLAPKGVAQMRNLLLKLYAERKLTILCACENLHIFSEFATRYGFLYQGKLQMELTAEELKEKNKEQTLEEYYTELVRSFAGRGGH